MSYQKGKTSLVNKKDYWMREKKMWQWAALQKGRGGLAMQKDQEWGKKLEHFWD